MASHTNWADECDSDIDDWEAFLNTQDGLSVHRPHDKYDTLGRNVSAQQRRQSKEPWEVVCRDKSVKSS